MLQYYDGESDSNQDLLPQMSLIQYPPIQTQLPEIPNYQEEAQNNQRKQRLKEYQNSLIKYKPKYIADNLYAVQIVQELTNAGICKISTILNGDYQTIQEKIIKYDKTLQLTELQSNLTKSAFFINTQQNQIVFQKGEIMFKQIQAKLKVQEGSEQKYIYLISVINLTINILEPIFIKELQLIVDSYIKQQKDKNTSQQKFIENLASSISSNNLQEFSYIQNWIQIKTKYKPVIVIYKQIKLLERKNELFARKSPKVLSKYSKKIDKLQQKLYKETILSPLEFLLTNLFQIFDQILTYYEKNQYQLSQMLQNQIKNEMKIEKQQQQQIPGPSTEFSEKKYDENQQQQFQNQKQQQGNTKYIVVDDEKDENLLEIPLQKKIKDNSKEEKLQ